MQIACLQAVTVGSIAENPFRSLIGRHLGFLRRALPGTSGRAQKSREGGGGGREGPAPPRSVLSKMAATKKRTPGCLAEEKLQRLQVGYNAKKSQNFVF